MTKSRICAAALCLILTSCSEPDPPARDPDVSDATLLEVAPVEIASPDGRKTLHYGGEGSPTLTLTSGDRRSGEFTTIEPVSRLVWAPNSARFYVNDSGSAAWNRLRVWTIETGVTVTERSEVSSAAVAELARRNGCTSPAESEYATQGLGWTETGEAIFVLAEVRREVNCRSGGAEYLVALVDAESAEILAVEQDESARSRWPALSWSPVTAP